MNFSTHAIAVIVLLACVGCASGHIRDDFVGGWQNQRDVFIHQFVHDRFVQEQRWAAESERLARSGSTDWADYAGPALAAATRAQAIAQDRGRAESLDRFLAHMQTTPTAEATAEWFASEAAAIRAGARDSAEATEALASRLAGEVAITDDLFQRIEATASAEGVVRGRALQHADLRRTVELYFQARDDDVVVPRPDGPRPDGDLVAGAGAAKEDALVRDVNTVLMRAQLRPVLLQPRDCERAEGVVLCVLDRDGAAALGDTSGGRAPVDRLAAPADDTVEAVPAMPRRGFDEGQLGW